MSGMRVKPETTAIRFLIFSLFLLLTACNETFAPLQDNSHSPFSMYGFIDASADTQWVRVIPIREQVNAPAEIPDMDISIKNVETGESIEMQDSLFQFRQEFNVVNSWTRANIQPEQTYRVIGKLPTGLTSQVTITTPKDFPMPNTDDFQGGCSGSLRMSGIDQLADVKSVWKIRFYFSGIVDERVIAIPYRRQVLDLREGDYSVYINYGKELSIITDQTLSTPDSLDVLSRKIFVASAGPEWNDEITSLEQLEYSLPIIHSNVENGVGYMIGIVSKTVDLTQCS